MQIADVRDVKSTATLCAHCVRAVKSHRTPCDGVYFEHAKKAPVTQNGDAAAFVPYFANKVI